MLVRKDIFQLARAGISIKEQPEHVAYASLSPDAEKYIDSLPDRKDKPVIMQHNTKCRHFWSKLIKM